MQYTVLYKSFSIDMIKPHIIDCVIVGFVEHQLLVWSIVGLSGSVQVFSVLEFWLWFSREVFILSRAQGLRVLELYPCCLILDRLHCQIGFCFAVFSPIF
jgi:hypothetical protein